MARRKLNESVAKDFIKGNFDEVETKDKESTVESKPKNKKISKKDLISRFKSNDSDEKNIRITVDLKASLHRKLSQLSLDSGKSKADIIRQLLEELFE